MRKDNQSNQKQNNKAKYNANTSANGGRYRHLIVSGFIREEHRHTIMNEIFFIDYLKNPTYERGLAAKSKILVCFNDELLAAFLSAYKKANISEQQEMLTILKEISFRGGAVERDETDTEVTRKNLEKLENALNSEVEHTSDAVKKFYANRHLETVKQIRQKFLNTREM